LEPHRLRDVLSYESGSVVSLTESMVFAMQGGQVRVSPAPSSGTVRIWYVPTFGNMVQGIAGGSVSAGNTKGLTLFSGNPNYVNNFGSPSKRDGYYVGMQVEMFSGGASGDVRTITAYDGGTRVATVDTSWTSAVVGNDQFALLCPVPEDFHDMVPLRAAILGSARNRNRQEELMTLYGASNRMGRMADLMAWVSRRHADHSAIAGVSDYGY